jgi:type II secretory pathway pseudopilin PulG
MKSSYQSGFTIIETTLFLGISGLLAAAVLIGTGSSLNTQRYMDSVRSLQSAIQAQYSEVANVINDSSTNMCGGSSASRGQSNCVAMGKLITSDGDKLTIKRVIGTIPVTPLSGSSDIEDIEDYNISYTDDGSSEYELDWGVNISSTHPSNQIFSMLIIRSPSSGLTRTFIRTDTNSISSSSLSSDLLMWPNAMNVGARLCVESNGLFPGNKMAVRVEPGASSASNVKLFGDSDSGC